jgi:hypothetical protein
MIIKSLAAAATLAAAGWGAHEYLGQTYAAREDVKIAQATADYVLDRQMEALLAQIVFLERLPNKTQGQWEQLRYLRRQL